MVHCSGGAQTKVLHFIGNLRVIKDNMFPIPPLFKHIQKESGSDWQEMYKVFNMGHRMEIYLPEEHAAEVMKISEKYGVEARILGRVEKADAPEVIVRSPYGEFIYR